MESLYMLIPLALLLVIVVAGILFWSIRQGQFEDMEGPAHSILMDDDAGGDVCVKRKAEKLDLSQDAGVRRNVASQRDQPAIKSGQ